MGWGGEMMAGEGEKKGKGTGIDMYILFKNIIKKQNKSFLLSKNNKGYSSHLCMSYRSFGTEG